ncbi:hypothetical protein ACIBOV_24810 [Micromonospora chersina]|uniref:hypothetical protein n=1 Tax=Micromonospora chersina TaxID=47854 RepID=UPI0037B24383
MGNFWIALAGVLITLVVGAITLWISYRQAFPSRRIVFLAEGEPLAPHEDDQKSSVVIHYNGREIQSPYLVELAVGNDGKRDITSDDFNAKKPLVFDLNAPVVGILKYASKPAGTMKPDVSTSDTRLSIEPGLLSSRQLLVFSLLVDGEPRAEYAKPLINVPIVSSQKVVEKRKRFSRMVRVVAFLAAAVSVVLPHAVGLTLAWSAPLLLIGGLLVVTATASDAVSGRVIGSSMLAVSRNIYVDPDEE